MRRNRTRRTVSSVLPARPCKGEIRVLPLEVPTHDMRLVARTIGPVEHAETGDKWNPVSEVFETHGVFHG